MVTQSRTSGASGPAADASAADKGAASRTSRIVQQAASILEEELAAGIEAARRIEARFVDVEKLRDRDSKEVMRRFRRDAHEVVDIVLDLVDVALNSLDRMAEQAPSRSDGNGSKPAGVQVAASFANVQPVKAGQSITTTMTLQNFGDVTVEAVNFHGSDLVSAEGARIPAQQVGITPVTLLIHAHSELAANVTISVPEGTPAGAYSGVLQASEPEQLRVEVTVQVE